MANIFLSYSRDDRPRAQIIAEALEAEGLKVWWDKVLRAGQTYDEVTETMLRDADVVVVLWSQTSVKSKWVRAEATLGQRHCELIPVMIEDAERPIMFELIQTADLINWDGDRSDERWINFVADIRRSAEKADTPVAATPAASPPPPPPPMPIPSKSDPTPPVQPAPVSPTVESKPEPQKKKSGGFLPVLLMLGVVGVAGYFGYEQFVKPDPVNPEPPEPPVIVELCEACPKMVELPGGTFRMGSPADEANRSGNEGPQRAVTLSGFSISRSEVTAIEWQACVEADMCRAAQGGSTGSEPVVGVSWNDATRYTSWLSEQTGQTYRLPSEAQWEYAARAGTTSAYWWGDSYSGAAGVVDGSLVDTASLPDNPFGLSGMLSNVREWVADCYVNNYRDAPTDGAAVTTGDCSLRVVRGGSFKTDAAEHRAANRARFGRDVRDRGLGFRVVTRASSS